MAKNTAVTELSDDDLVASLSEAKEELFNLRFQLVTGQLDNYSRIKFVKKNVARAMTELRSREIAKADALAESSVSEGEATSEASATEENDG